MTEQDSFYPLEFFVLGTPISLQARNSRAVWMAKVTDIAQRRIKETDELGFLYRRPFAVTIYYFSAAHMEGDIDNIVKPILDALANVAYVNDNDVERIVAQKFEPEVDWSFADPSFQLAAALETDPPVVYIRVDDDLGWRSLP